MEGYSSLLWILVWGALFFFMMRFGCGSHIGGHGGHGHGSPSPGGKVKDPVCGMDVNPERQRRSRFIALSAVVLALAVPMPTHSQGMMDGGMMGGGMMGGGMMGGYGPRGEPGPGQASNPRWDQLSAYVQNNSLACMSCHRYSGRGTGPAFADIAQRFAGHAGSREELARAISNGVSGQWPGYPAMPGGLATPGEARELAGLVLRLVRE